MSKISTTEPLSKEKVVISEIPADHFVGVYSEGDTTTPYAQRTDFSGEIVNGRLELDPIANDFGTASAGEWHGGYYKVLILPDTYAGDENYYASRLEAVEEFTFQARGKGYTLSHQEYYFNSGEQLLITNPSSNAMTEVAYMAEGKNWQQGGGTGVNTDVNLQEIYGWLNAGANSFGNNLIGTGILPKLPATIHIWRFAKDIPQDISGSVTPDFVTAHPLVLDHWTIEVKPNHKKYEEKIQADVTETGIDIKFFPPATTDYDAGGFEGTPLGVWLLFNHRGELVSTNNNAQSVGWEFSSGFYPGDLTYVRGGTYHILNVYMPYYNPDVADPQEDFMTYEEYLEYLDGTNHGSLLVEDITLHIPNSKNAGELGEKFTTIQLRDRQEETETDSGDGVNVELYRADALAILTIGTVSGTNPLMRMSILGSTDGGLTYPEVVATFAEINETHLQSIASLGIRIEPYTHLKASWVIEGTDPEFDVSLVLVADTPTDQAGVNTGEPHQ